MKFIFNILLVAIISAVLQWALGYWWLIGIAAFFVGTLTGSKSGTHSFFIGFLGIMLLWASIAFYKSFPNEFMLAEKMSKIFFLESPFAILGITALIGGIVGGFAALSGNSLYKVIVKKPKSRY
jgi:hypothetical protein